MVFISTIIQQTLGVQYTNKLSCEHLYCLSSLPPKMSSLCILGSFFQVSCHNTCSLGVLSEWAVSTHHLTTLVSMPVQLFLICLLAVTVHIDKCTKSKPTNTRSLCACLSLSQDTAELRNTDVITLCNYAPSTHYNARICGERV